MASAGRRTSQLNGATRRPTDFLGACRSHGASAVRPALRCCSRSPAHVALTGRGHVGASRAPSRQLRESRTSGRTCQRTGATRASVPGASCGSRSPALGTQPSPSNRAPVWSAGQGAPMRPQLPIRLTAHTLLWPGSPKRGEERLCDCTGELGTLGTMLGVTRGTRDTRDTRHTAS